MSANLDAIRVAFLERQGLHSDPLWRTVQESISQIAAVQIDTIAVVARSHHLTLRHRVQNYTPEKLWSALQKAQVFEYLAHSTCFIPIHDYPFYRPSMRRFASSGPSYFRQWLASNQEIVEAVLSRIQEEGPLTSRDFQDPSHQGKGWWNWKPAKIALDVLWRMGHIAIRDRAGFQRVYDLAERVIPSQYLNQSIDLDEEWSFFLSRALDCLVAGTQRDLIEYFQFHPYSLNIPNLRKRVLTEKLEQLQKQDIIVKISNRSMKNPYYTLPKYIDRLTYIQDQPPRTRPVRFLTPFDNILWDRKRVQRLFNVEIVLEAYLPAAKRKFGYYCMPILWNDQLIGRLDPKADYKTKTLIIHNLEITLSKKDIETALDALRREINRFMQFHGLEQLHIRQIEPSSLKKALTN